MHATVAGVLRDPVAIGIVAGLVGGKTTGITLTTWLVARFTRARLDEGLAWIDIVGLAVLGGIGFTVSLLIGELAFGAGSAADEHVKVAVLTGSLLAAALATVILRGRNRVYRRMHTAAEASRRPCGSGRVREPGRRPESAGRSRRPGCSPRRCRGS